jgi:alkylation response protein AidB-like acyl-CoA dehydrogenase
MTGDAPPSPSFVRGIFAGAIHDSLLFPFPEPLDARDPEETRTVRRLLESLDTMRRSGLIDSARFDEEETIPEEVIRTLAETGWLGLSIRGSTGDWGSPRPLTPTCSA